MSDDFDKIAELVRNGYSIDEALNHVPQTVPDGGVSASSIDTATLTPIVQIVRDDDGIVSTGTTAIPADDTTPQITEGDEYLSVSITPKYADSVLYITAQVLGSLSAVGTLTAAVFKTGTSDALATGYTSMASVNQYKDIYLNTKIAAGSTSSQTFSVRMGGDTGTTTFNGNGATQYFNGTSNSFIQVMEILQ